MNNFAVYVVGRGCRRRNNGVQVGAHAGGPVQAAGVHDDARAAPPPPDRCWLRSYG